MLGFQYYLIHIWKANSPWARNWTPIPPPRDCRRPTFFQPLYVGYPNWVSAKKNWRFGRYGGSRSHGDLKHSWMSGDFPSMRGRKTRGLWVHCVTLILVLDLRMSPSVQTCSENSLPSTPSEAWGLEYVYLYQKEVHLIYLSRYYLF